MRQRRREPVAVTEQIGIDATGIDFKEALEPWRGIGVKLVGGLFQVGATHQPVDFQYIRAGNLGQATLGQQAHADHLPDAVTGMHIAQCEKGVVEVAAFDQRHAHGIAPYRDVLRQAFKGLYAAGRWHAVAMAAHLAAAQGKHAEHRCGYAEPGEERGEGWRGHGRAPAGRGV
ncbi:hypothetical protein D3C76_894730 [compost metagenome]